MGTEVLGAFMRSRDEIPRDGGMVVGFICYWWGRMWECPLLVMFTSTEPPSRRVVLIMERNYPLMLNGMNYIETCPGHRPESLSTTSTTDTLVTLGN